MIEPLIYDFSTPGRRGVSLPQPDVPEAKLPDAFKREQLLLPELSELEVVRHFVRLSQLNHSIDTGFYPLGSCTMKYNPKINEDTARLPGFAFTHPFQHPDTAQGNLAVMFSLQEWLKEIGRFAGVSMQPAAGAHGELTGILIIRAYHKDRGDQRRDKILVPDSAHGTNPASVTLAGYRAQELKSDGRGLLHPDTVREAMGPHVAALMMTNPNTLGLFETHCHDIAEIVHAAGALLYMDGANLNALFGVTRPGDVGFDAVHFNLHKSFSTPHGGGGPGAGPVGVMEALEGFLPVPTVGCDGEHFYLNYDHPQTIGRVGGFYGNFEVLVKAYTYIHSMGGDGLSRVAELSVLNANYLAHKIPEIEGFNLPYGQGIPRKHECVIS